MLAGIIDNKLKIKPLYIAIIIFASVNLFAQGPLGEKDTLAFLRVFNPILVSENSLEFELMIKRNSDQWIKLANGTFQFEFEMNNQVIEPGNIVVELLETELPEQLVPGNVLPTQGYYIENQIFDERLSITVLGPPTYDLCELIPRDSFLLIGKFRVSTVDGNRMPASIKWKSPYDYYQATAFKLEQDSLINQFIVWYENDDNVPMDDKIASTVKYDADIPDQYRFILDFFDADYAGRKVVDLRIGTLEEYNHLGFTILRAPHVNLYQDPYTLDYQDTIHSYLPGKYYNPDLIGVGTSQAPYEYEESQDLVPYRGGQYCYALYASFEMLDGSRMDSLVAIDCDQVPHAVIAKATPLQNPFTVSTIIEYELQDDVILTVKAYDLLGREIKKLNDDATNQSLDNIEMKKGIHYTTFYAPELASQGLYDIIFIAEPIDDSAFESSTAVVKLQLIKDGTR